MKIDWEDVVICGLSVLAIVGTNETSRPAPWLTITLCIIGILVLIAISILQIASFRQASRHDLF